MAVNNTTQIHAFTIGYPQYSSKLFSEVSIIFNNRQIQVTALWDTGATSSCISHDVVKTLQLISVGKTFIRTPSGEAQPDVYVVDVGLPNGIGVKDVRVVESEIGNQNIGILIGMDIISLGDFAVSNHNAKTQFSFRIPSVSEADFVKYNTGFKNVPIVNPNKV